MGTPGPTPSDKAGILKYFEDIEAKAPEDMKKYGDEKFYADSPRKNIDGRCFEALKQHLEQRKEEVEKAKQEWDIAGENLRKHSEWEERASKEKPEPIKDPEQVQRDLESAKSERAALSEKVPKADDPNYEQAKRAHEDQNSMLEKKEKDLEEEFSTAKLFYPVSKKVKKEIEDDRKKLIELEQKAGQFRSNKKYDAADQNCQQQDMENMMEIAKVRARVHDMDAQRTLMDKHTRARHASLRNAEQEKALNFRSAYTAYQEVEQATIRGIHNYQRRIPLSAQKEEQQCDLASFCSLM